LKSTELGEDLEDRIHFELAFVGSRHVAGLTSGTSAEVGTASFSSSIGALDDLGKRRVKLSRMRTVGCFDLERLAEVRAAHRNPAVQTPHQAFSPPSGFVDTHDQSLRGEFAQRLLSIFSEFTH